MDFERRPRRGGVKIRESLFNLSSLCIVNMLFSFNGTIERDIVIDLPKSAVFEPDKRLNIRIDHLRRHKGPWMDDPILQKCPMRKIRYYFTTSFPNDAHD
jgi:hypothetical protein